MGPPQSLHYYGPNNDVGERSLTAPFILVRANAARADGCGKIPVVYNRGVLADETTSGVDKSKIISPARTCDHSHPGLAFTTYAASGTGDWLIAGHNLNGILPAYSRIPFEP